MEYTTVEPSAFQSLEGLGDWTVIQQSVHASFVAADYLSAARLVVSIAEIAERHVHHPDLELQYPGKVLVALTTHATGGLTTLDVDVARAISAAAAEAGATPTPQR